MFLPWGFIDELDFTYYRLGTTYFSSPIARLMEEGAACGTQFL